MQKNAKIIAVVNQKGGTGKTTTTENIGIGLVNEGKKVLLIDMDPQGSLTISLGIAKMQAEMASDFGLIMAGAALAAVPIIAVFLMFQSYFTKGITMGAVKG